MAQFCNSCGAPLRNPEAAYCPTCGHPQQIRPAQPFLLLQVPGQPPQAVPIERTLRIGRDPSNDLVIAFGAVSRYHAAIEQQNGRHFLQDLGSTNGTYVNNVRAGAQLQPLEPGDVIRIGDEAGNNVRLVFQLGAAASGEPAPFAIPGTMRLTELPMGTQERLTLGRAADNQLALAHPAVSRYHAEIRQTPAGAILTDLGSQNGTYLNGARVRGPQQLHAGDVIQLGPYKVVYGQEGSRLLDPHGNFRVDAVGLERIITIKGRPALFGGRQSAQRRAILKKINLSIQPREFVAFVGGSGAGKSTLLKAISGFAPADGHVFVNGDDLYANFPAYRHILGYVPQDDIIHGLLPVRDALRYAAQLRLPDLTRPEIEDRINRVLTQVEMMEHADKQISRLSGGQRKRVSIAVELLAEPYLFFLDEPTSGLDPGLEKKMMFTLRNLADEGRTIILVTHATANIEQCTHVAFLADGYMPFFGPPQEARDFFVASDFADIYTRLSQPLNETTEPLPAPLQPVLHRLQAENPGAVVRAPDLWHRYFLESDYYQKYVAHRGQAARQAAALPAARPASADGQRVDRFEQWRVLTRRYFHLLRRDTMSLFVLLAVMPIIGLLLLVMADRYDLVGQPAQSIRQQIQADIAEARAEQDRRVDDETFSGTYVVANSAQRFLFMLALAANLLGVFAAAYEIVKEAPIYERERMVNLKIVPYLLSKFAILALFALLQAFLLLLVVGLKVDFPANGVFLPPLVEMYLTLFLATLASIGLGLLISAAVKNQDTVIYVILVVLFVQIMFAGAIFDLPRAAQPVSYLTTTRWTLEALGSIADLPALNELGVTCIEFEDENTQRLMPDADRPCSDSQMKQPAPFDFNVQYKPTIAHLLSRWLGLLLFAVITGAAAYYLQKKKDVLG